jgi:hypothetical protein
MRKPRARGGSRFVNNFLDIAARLARHDRKNYCTFQEERSMEPTATKTTLVQRARHELIEYIVISAYLYICFGALILYKATVLRAHGIEYEAFGLALVKALVLGKFILIANTLRFGELSGVSRPMLKILCKTLFFGLLLVVLSVAEEAIVGLIHGRTTRESLGEIADGSLPQALAIGLLMMLILIPFFAFREISARLGEGNLMRLLTARAIATLPNQDRKS